MPYAKLSDRVDGFVLAAYDHGWERRDFDWGQWAHTAEAARLRDEPNALAEALPDDLARMLTVRVRRDRFVEGALLDAFESGLILRIVRRAAELAREA